MRLVLLLILFFLISVLSIFLLGLLYMPLESFSSFFINTFQYLLLCIIFCSYSKSVFLLVAL